MPEKAVSILLQDGNLEGIITMECTSWNSGILYSTPREAVDRLVSETSSKYGIYLLLSEEMVYVGQSIDLSKRIKQHTTGKDWWNKAIVLTTKDNSFTRTDIDYLEAALITKAKKNNKLHCDNKKDGNPSKIDKFRKVLVDQYLTEALLIIQLLGVTVFTEQKTIKVKKEPEAISDSESLHEEFNKPATIAFLNSRGVPADNTFTYAKMQKRKTHYWANPRVEIVDDDWNIILNNQFDRIITYLKVPAKTFTVTNEKGKGLFARKDRPYYIDLNLKANTYIDVKSEIDFSVFVTGEYKY